MIHLQEPLSSLAAFTVAPGSSGVMRSWQTQLDRNKLDGWPESEKGLC